MKIALLRHGPTLWNLEGRVQGHKDIGLSQEGVAALTGLALPEEIYSSKDLTPVYVSPLKRARASAQLLGLWNPKPDARLMEQNWGAWEGLTRGEILARYGQSAFVDAGSQKGETFRPPGGESTRELNARVGQFLKEVAKKDETAVAVTHLGVLRAAYTLATGWDMATPMPTELDISKILLLQLDQNGSARIEGLNIAFIARKA